MQYVRTFRPGWTSACLLALVCVTSSGCAKVYHAVHYNPLSLAVHEHSKNYYHSDKTGRVVAKHRCFIPEEPPCYGYEPTCWTRWPSDCPKCPVDCECEQEVVLHEHEIQVPHDSVVAQPQPVTAAEPAVEPLEPAEPEVLSEPVSPDAVEPDYEDGANIAPIISPEQLSEYRPSSEPSDETTANVRWLPGSTSKQRESIEEASQPIEQPQSIADPNTESPSQITRPVTPAPVPVPPSDRRSSRRNRTIASQSPSRTIGPEKGDAEVEADANFAMLATATWAPRPQAVAKSVDSKRIPTFKIAVKTSSPTSIAKSNNADSKLSKHPKSKVTTASFR